MNNKFLETIIFSLIMVIFGFITSYVTDFVSGKEIVWFPTHSMAMASGTFFTAFIVFLLFSENYINYKIQK